VGQRTGWKPAVDQVGIGVPVPRSSFHLAAGFGVITPLDNWHPPVDRCVADEPTRSSWSCALVRHHRLCFDPKLAAWLYHLWGHSDEPASAFAVMGLYFGPDRFFADAEPRDSLHLAQPAGRHPHYRLRIHTGRFFFRSNNISFLDELVRGEPYMGLFRVVRTPSLQLPRRSENFRLH
jgi:hypothetical protein